MSWNSWRTSQTTWTTHHNIKFTTDRETHNHLPFLDTDVYTRPHGSLGHSIKEDHPHHPPLFEWQVVSPSGKQEVCAFHIDTHSQSLLQPRGPPWWNGIPPPQNVQIQWISNLADLSTLPWFCLSITSKLWVFHRVYPHSFGLWKITWS